MENVYDLIIVGSGPAGLSAAIYAGRFRLKTLVLGEMLGGEMSLAGKIWNYPGVRNMDGYEIAKTMKEQAKDAGAEFLDENADSVAKKGDTIEIIAGGKIFNARSIILATGSERRKLGLQNEAELTGKGVHYCVTCDGPLYAGKTVAMVGGANAAVKGALLASEHAKKVYIIAIEKELICEPAYLEELKKKGGKIEIINENKVVEIAGKDKLEKVVLDREFNGSKEIILDGLFIEIGSIPDNRFAVSLGVELDPRGYARTDAELKTNVQGVFVAGDLSNLFGSFKQIVSAAATGSAAANSAHEFIKTARSLP